MAKTIVQPYLFFSGRCEEAIEFYRTTLGAEIAMIVRFKESPEPPPGGLAPGWEEKIMHASFTIGESTLMASDGSGQSEEGFAGFSLSLSFPDEAAARRAFDALADGGKVELPLSKTFFSPCFGMLMDRFGVSWMILVGG